MRRGEAGVVFLGKVVIDEGDDEPSPSGCWENVCPDHVGGFFSSLGEGFA